MINTDLLEPCEECGEHNWTDTGELLRCESCGYEWDPHEGE